MPVIDEKAFRENVRNAFANPSPEIIAEVIEHTGNTDLVEMQKRWAEVYADIAVLTMREMAEHNTPPITLIQGIAAAISQPLQNLFTRIADPEQSERARRLAAEHLVSACMLGENDFVGVPVGIPTKADA